MGPVCSVDADRYVRSWVLLSGTRLVSQLLLESTTYGCSFSLLLPGRVVNVADPASFYLR